MRKQKLVRRPRAARRVTGKTAVVSGPPGLAGRAARWIAKPKTKSSERRRQKIFDDAIEAGTAITKAEGLVGLTARNIANRIGCSVGTLYNVFDSLDTLILHLNGRTFDALYEEMKGIEVSQDVEETVRSIAEIYLGFVRKNTNSWKVIFDHVWPPDYPLPPWYMEKIQRLLALLVDAVAPMFPPGEKDKARQAAVLLWSSLHGIQSLSLDAKLGFITSDTAHDLTGEMVRTILVGLRDTLGHAAPAE